MKNWLLIGLLAFAASDAFADTRRSPFESTVDGITVPNAHLLPSSPGKVLRGMQPDAPGEIDMLARWGVTDVVIFKKPTGSDVSDETDRLKAAGLEENRIHHIPFKWQGFRSFQEGCSELVEALQILRAVERSRGRAVYFHCTYGEDRTGALAGLFRVLKGTDVREAFQNEMCAWGYSGGNPDKPANVVRSIDQELTSIYLRTAYLIAQGAIDPDRPDPSACATDPARDRAYQRDSRYRLSNYRCEVSPNYPDGE